MFPQLYDLYQFENSKLKRFLENQGSTAIVNVETRQGIEMLNLESSCMPVSTHYSQTSYENEGKYHH